MLELEHVAESLDAISSTPALSAADDMARAFELAGDRIATALEQAARSGELSFNSLAENITRSLAQLAIQELVLDPLQNALGRLGGAAGNSVSPVAPNITLNLNGVSDAAGLSKTTGQLAGALARAVGAGQGYI